MAASPPRRAATATRWNSFFRSLAEDQAERAIAIVLSGTGTNGSLGLRFVKAEGGIALAQDPETAAFDGMPRAAIATGVVDLVLPPGQMPEALLSIARHSYVRQPAATLEEPAPEDQLKALLTAVRATTGQDFGSYRKRTLLRRIHRRMGLHRIEGLADYVLRLRGDPREVRALAADLTINVTGFFRDPEAWQALADKVVRPLLRERPAGSTIRVWVPGCSTGEEAYSIAMVFFEQAAAAQRTIDLRVFATDVAAGVFASARGGVYPGSIAQDVSAERLERWFDKDDDTYCVRRALRETITFAPQNLLQDPPFSRLDLISCRNLLIYLEPEIQKRIVSLFHFALREGGHMFLGPAETIGGEDELFSPVSKKWRIFQRLGPTRHELVDFPIISSGDGLGAAPEATAAVEPPLRAGQLMDQALLERYAPASALIDTRFRVLYLRGPTENYLRPPAGEPSYDLLAMAREGLQAALRMTVRQAIEQGGEATGNARVRRGDAVQPVRIVVAPLRTGRDTALRLLVGFLDREPASAEAATADVDEALSEDQLQSELYTTREDLRFSIEQMEATNEELKASNEEIRSINEELQASNEELETSKEELQSLNEELNTVNNQLQAKVGELEARTDDLNNLLNSTDIATLFLDRSLCIRWFTPSMRSLLELLPTDIGRPVTHFAQRFSNGSLVEEARKVLERLLPADAEVVDDLGRWYIRHIVPYRTAADRIDGVVVTFTEITERKRREREALEAKEFAEAIVGAVRFPLVVLTPELRVRSANAAFYETFEVRPDETEGRPLAQLGNRQWEHSGAARAAGEGPARAGGLRRFRDRARFRAHRAPHDAAARAPARRRAADPARHGRPDRAPPQRAGARAARARAQPPGQERAGGGAGARHPDRSQPVGRGLSRDFPRPVVGARTGAQPAGRVGMAPRGSQAAGREGARSLPGRAPRGDRGRRPVGAAVAQPGHRPGPDPARARHQRREVRRAVAARGAGPVVLAGRGRRRESRAPAAPRLAGAGRAAGGPAEGQRLRHPADRAGGQL